MQDLDDGSRIGRRRLSAIQGERTTPTVTTRDTTSVVPADKLLEAAGALAQGASAMHAHMRRLSSSERDELLGLFADQLSEIVQLWMAMVRGVVTSGDTAPAAPPHDAPVPRTTPSQMAPVAPPPPPVEHRVTTPGPTVAGPTVADHPARVASTRPAAVQAPPVGRSETSTSRGDSERAGRDELTGVFDRASGLQALAREIDRCRRGGERCVLGYLNVDGLKAVNDASGTHAGDELLRNVTATLRATLRSYDVITRVGDDEFLFSLPGADLGTAELRFKEFAALLSSEADGASASVGFAELHQHDTLDDVVAAAESAMLKGRRSRRRGRG
jgi:diguanylate cyclase (GGDEF)-like protein